MKIDASKTYSTMEKPILKVLLMKKKSQVPKKYGSV